MKILIVGGFLGSGKTSVILKLAEYLINEKIVEHIAVLENEIGEVGIDDQVLKSSGLKVRGLFAGCVCCTLAGELPVTVRTIEQELSPELLIVEATGVAFPYDILENLERNLELSGTILCVVDAKRWPRLHKPLEHLFTHQLKATDVILVNKTDLVDADTKEAVAEDVRVFAPEAQLFFTNAEADGPFEDALLERLKEAVL